MGAASRPLLTARSATAARASTGVSRPQSRCRLRVIACLASSGRTTGCLKRPSPQNLALTLGFEVNDDPTNQWYPPAERLGERCQ